MRTEMSTMIERVARAMFDATNEHDETWDTEAQEIKTTYLIMARAAIEAMREPTEAMVAAAEAGDDQGSSIYGDPFVALPHDDAWRSMIDAALNEQVSGWTGYGQKADLPDGTMLYTRPSEQAVTEAARAVCDNAKLVDIGKNGAFNYVVSPYLIDALKAAMEAGR